MTATTRRIGQGIAGVLAVLAVLAGAAPFLDAGRFRDSVRTALETVLRRQVRLGEIHYQLFPAPGLSASNVVIAEDPEFGLDATAYVDDLDVQLRLLPLLQGRMDVAALRLTDASVNLARNESGDWALRRMLNRPRGESRRPPRLLIRNGRINFRTGTMKSPFYLNSVDLDLEAAISGGLGWRYEASPARTDRAEQGFGRFSGNGKWQPGDHGGTLDIELSLERSATAEVSILLASRDIGLPGRVWSQARLFGPLSQVKIAGTLQFEGLERSGLLPFRDTRLSIPYEGVVDLPAQKLVLATLRPKDASLPFSAECRVENFLGNLVREVVFRFDKMPAGSLLEISRRLGQTVPEGLAVEGEINGTISAGESGVSGAIDVSAPRLRIRDLAAIEAASARIAILNDEVRLEPVQVTSGDVEANLEGSWRTRDGALRFAGQVTNLPLAGVRAAARQLSASRPFPPQIFGTAGRVSGAVRYDSAQAEEPWSGEFTLTGAQAEVAGLSGAVEIRRADVRVRGDQWSLRGIQGLAGTIPFVGEYTHTPAAKRPDRVALRVRDADAGEIESLFAPVLERDRGLLERALRLRSNTLPGWLRTRHAEARVAIENLRAGRYEFHAVRATLYWDGAHAEFPDVVAQWSGAPFRGYLHADLTAPQPKYWLKGQLEGLAYLGGFLDFDLEARGAGFGGVLPASASGSADFRGRDLQPGDEMLRQASGTLDLMVDRSGVSARIRPLEVVSGSDVMVGHGTISAEGLLTAEVSNAKRSLRLTFALDEAGGSAK
ncbi:MAG: AsmA family protein [Bryobacterales bacterium]|nr:AsmA family protein [Bryobacterales bacterium]